jgi:hypothetical protein
MERLASLVNSPKQFDERNRESRVMVEFHPFLFCFGPSAQCHCLLSPRFASVTWPFPLLFYTFQLIHSTKRKNQKQKVVKFISGIEDLASTVKWPRWFERVRRWAPPSAETGYTGCIRPWAIVAKVCETNKKKKFYSQKQARIKCNLITRDQKNWKKTTGW